MAGFLTGPAPGQPIDVVLGYLQREGARFGVAPADLQTLRVSSYHTESTGAGSTHIYLRQSFNGLQVETADLNFSVTPRGEIITAGGSFIAGLSALDQGQPPAPALSALDALGAAAWQLGLDPAEVPVVVQQGGAFDQHTVIAAPGISLDPVTANLAYQPDGQGGAALVWSVVIRPPGRAAWYDANIDAQTGELLGFDDWVSHARYNVFALPVSSPQNGGRSIVVDPWNLSASPLGWHNVNGTLYSDTRGNNVFAQEDTDANDTGGRRPDGGATLNFDFPYDPSQAPSTYENAAITNAFYVVNVLHDILYLYGFDEQAGNFQEFNFGRGGAEGDAVRADVQDGSGVNNAFFGTPPDGQPGRMTMLLFNVTTPMRDSAFANDVIAHEIAHGLSNRLTGGRTNAGALTALQSSAMGEGWSDYLSLMVTQRPSWQRNDPRPVGNWLLGQPANGPGIRRYPYSYDMSVNPLRLNNFNGGFPNNQSHNAGEIWASVLWDMTWNLIDKYGYDPDLARADLTKGNHLALRLVIDGMKLQPANPSFLEARDAILLADQALTGGQNQPEIWAAFARRGFGLSASTAGSSSATVVDRTDMPQFISLTVTPPSGLRENEPAGQYVVATFRDPLDPLPPGGYIVTVDWGDGLIQDVTSVQVVQVGPNDFQIRASRSFPEGGTFNLRITLTKPGAMTIVRQDSYTVEDLPILPGPPVLITGTEGDTFSGIVATFFDTDPDLLAASSYTALILWGDVGELTSGIVEADPSAGPNHFRVRGEHVFGGGDNVLVRVTIVGPGGGGTVVNSRADIVDSELESGPFSTLRVTEGTPFPALPLIWFTDADPRQPPASNYEAQILWGDGTESIGRIEPNIYTPEGGWLVFGDHLLDYSSTPYNVVVLVRNFTGPNTTTSIVPIVVDDAPLIGSGLNFTATEGAPFNQFFALFDDTDPRRHSASRYTAQVVWEPGGPASTTANPQALVVTTNTDGGFLLRGSHIFSRPGVYQYTATITDSTGVATVTVGGTVTVPAAPLTVRVQPAVQPSAGQTFNGVIATFTTPNSLARPADFVAEIRWGDGSVTPNAAIERDPRTGEFRIRGSNAYNQHGAYNVVVIVRRPGSNPTQANGLVNVAGAPITAQAVPVSGPSKTSLGEVVVARLQIGHPNPSLNGVTATIAWGDGQTGTGRIVPAAGGGFEVRGAHQFSRAGNFPVLVTINGPGGSGAVVNSVASISPRAFPVTGTVVGGLDGGAAVNTSTPVLRGQAEPNASVQLYVVPAGGHALQSIGTTTAGPDGAWNLVASNLADGTYMVIASAYDALGDLSSPATMLLPTSTAAPLVVDTQGPRVQNVALDPRTGSIQVVLADSGSGLATPGVLDPANFALIVGNGRTGRTLRPTGISLTPAESGGAALATLTFGGLGRLNRGGNLVFEIAANGVTDRAGNPLVERQFLPFPGVAARPGQNFVGQFRNVGGASTLVPYIPPDEIAAAGQFRNRFLTRRLPARRV